MLDAGSDLCWIDRICLRRLCSLDQLDLDSELLKVRTNIIPLRVDESYSAWWHINTELLFSAEHEISVELQFICRIRLHCLTL